ncbi:hypothetical protein [Jhaorihella thermophila]|uniref:Uncharacterized protein n=1 Tax=Jhaorihella thermophila TaxID=488547 RepID=A0A1H5UG19_9RHOB|nr:hypothetical protein [Jhaorihella thermophila]SEF74005.1 hypothetical protein SAMN05421751_10442 [Jhaorihella thermophila]
MILFLLLNAAFLGSFVWLSLTGASLAVWAVWIVLWLAADYATMWLTGYAPPAWAFALAIAILAALWGGLALYT